MNWQLMPLMGINIPSVGFFLCIIFHSILSLARYDLVSTAMLIRGATEERKWQQIV